MSRPLTTKFNVYSLSIQRLLNCSIVNETVCCSLWIHFKLLFICLDKNISDCVNEYIFHITWAKYEIYISVTSVLLRNDFWQACFINMEEVDLSGCSMVTDTGIYWLTQVTQHAPNLKSVSMRLLMFLFSQIYWVCY